MVGEEWIYIFDDYVERLFTRYAEIAGVVWQGSNDDDTTAAICEFTL